MDQTAVLAREFERETYRIEQLVWDAMALRAGETALFCGSSNNVNWIKRAVQVGVAVSVVANESSGIGELDGLGVTVLRGSSSMIPARDESFDASIAFHHLHEIDPFFHANVVSELGRVGKRSIIVEPAPPSDPLGQRIASLYSRAKRELGQFENYHHIDYWRKLLSIVKPNVTYQTFSFTRNPPREAVRGTVALILDTMAAEETPEAYLTELRALAKRPDAQLVPQARCVVVGTPEPAAAGAGAGTNFRDSLPEYARPAVIASPFTNGALRAAAASAGTVPPAVAARIYSAADTQPELPRVEPPAAPAGRVPAADPGQVARNAFGLGSRAARPTAPSVSGDDDADFGVSTAGDAAAEFGWEWESPDTP